MPNQLSFNQAQKSIRKAAKRVLTEKGLNPSTRKGNKEFDFLLQQLSSVVFASDQAAIAAGEQLGEKIAELSQQQNKQDLDRGVIRHLAMKTDWVAELGLTVASVSAAATPPAVIESQSTAAPISAPTQEIHSATTSPADIADTEDVTPAAAAAETPADIETEPEAAAPEAPEAVSEELEAATLEAPEAMSEELEVTEAKETDAAPEAIAAEDETED
ncbi:MAG: hypothetical protein HC873_17190 [Leptolyngbyaceae cyanobacterium SL_1_1]|nr:hypothetical protein [Leptolyngbyaceae cyanobacterium RM1_1_2]NJO11086.1 hypothetical protein [Leptolyngbyaceae cyanobacterium SL_1_1]